MYSATTVLLILCCTVLLFNKINFTIFYTDLPEKKLDIFQLATRAAEREMKESRHECGMLRQKYAFLTNCRF